MDELHRIRTFHIFSGAGGGILADIILGHRPVCAVEINPYARKVLEQRQQDGLLPFFPIWDDVKTFAPGPWAGKVDCISAGFPCTDISVAGKQEGITGKESSLVWEVFRAVDAIRPKYIFLENSPNIRTKGRKEIITAIVERGYSWRDGILAASDVGAPHKRARWWLLASHTDGKSSGWCARKSIVRKETCCSVEDATDSMRIGLQISTRRGGISESSRDTIQAAEGYTCARGWAPIDPDFCGMVHELADRMDGDKTARIKVLGNGQVPLVAAAAFLFLLGDK